MSRMTANNTKISYKAGSVAQFTELDLLMEVPELGATPEKIDVTVLTDPVKRYVNGIKDFGDLVFKFLYDNTSATSNYRVLKGLQDAETEADFKVEYPDGTSHAFKATVTLKMDAGSINGALTFSCTMNVTSDITISNPV